MIQREELLSKIVNVQKYEKEYEDIQLSEKQNGQIEDDKDHVINECSPLTTIDIDQREDPGEVIPDSQGKGEHV